MSPPDRDEFRAVMGRFATGVTIVTTRLGDELHGMTANAVSAVSLDPPLVLVCIDRSADSHDIVDASGIFALSILGREQYELSRRFAVKEGSAAHQLGGVPYHAGATGAPVIDGSLAYLDCRIVGRYPGGDHTIFVGEVVDAGRLDGGEPLVFYEGRYGGIS
ncbi:MAG TPA: flavin reductase family protein [Methylomirabilota bacterium]|nr:flavin reductase family protein [Methylomirabilota bacterium]